MTHEENWQKVWVSNSKTRKPKPSINMFLKIFTSLVMREIKTKTGIRLVKFFLNIQYRCLQRCKSECKLEQPTLDAHLATKFRANNSHILYNLLVLLLSFYLGGKTQVPNSTCTRMFLQQKYGINLKNLSTREYIIFWFTHTTEYLSR